MTRKTAVILFNLGGPDSLSAVQPFLFNLFNDPAIIRLPNPFRWLLAKLISTRRGPVAQEIYRKMGGRSPILPQTEAQARALEAALNQSGAGEDHRVFIAMRYWHPFADETAKAVKDWGAERVVLLPLYPQFSTTTTASSFGDWQRAADRVGLRVPVSSIGCYSDQPGFVAAQTALLKDALPAAEAKGPVRILFSAHGLPKKVVLDGDPYQMQVERSVAAIRRALGRPELDIQICYQSRVGPLEWIGPATDAEIARAALERRAIVVVPVAFVSEHSETLVELDIEYAELAQHNGAAAYIRVPTVGVQRDFIDGLATLVRRARFDAAGPRCGGETGLCDAAWRRCICRGGSKAAA
jgi:ferrochelatase